MFNTLDGEMYFSNFIINIAVSQPSLSLVNIVWWMFRPRYLIPPLSFWLWADRDSRAPVSRFTWLLVLYLKCQTNYGTQACDLFIRIELCGSCQWDALARSYHYLIDSLEQDFWSCSKERNSCVLNQISLNHCCLFTWNSSFLR